MAKSTIIENPGLVWYEPDFLTPQEADTLFEVLQTEIPWQETAIRIFGKWILQPRLIHWQGTPGIPYSYSGITLYAEGFHPKIEALNEKIEGLTGIRFNSVLLNLYRNGNDSMGYHADDEKELGADPVIASVTLGDCRDFVLRNKHDHSQRIKIKPIHGSLLWMDKGIQTNWQHALPKRSKGSVRINLTFRQIFA